MTRQTEGLPQVVTPKAGVVREESFEREGFLTLESLVFRWVFSDAIELGETKFFPLREACFY